MIWYKENEERVAQRRDKGKGCRLTAGKVCGLAALTALLPVAVHATYTKKSAARLCLPLFEEREEGGTATPT